MERLPQDTFDNLIRSQQTDGSWTGGHVGPVFITAVHLSILQLDNATLFRGIVSGFDTASGATIDVASVATGAKEKLALVDNGNGTETLKVSNGTSHAALTLDGQFVLSGFHTTPDAGGTGTAITYTAPGQNAPNLTVAHA